jgi:hypothetical protein
MLVKDFHFMTLPAFKTDRYFGPVHAHDYESPSFVKKERTMGASVNLPFVYPSIGASLAPVASRWRWLPHR